MAGMCITAGERVTDDDAHHFPLVYWRSRSVARCRTQCQPTTTRRKDELYAREMMSARARNASPYRRLKLVMEYWFARWFWPVMESESLPESAEWWLASVNMLYLLTNGHIPRYPTP